MKQKIHKLKTFLDLFRRGYITPKKLINIGLVYSSMWLRMPKTLGKPFTLLIEPTNTCNLACPTCPTGNKTSKRIKGFMDFENYKKLIDELAPYLVNVTLYNYGEPFLHKNIYEMIRYAKNKKVQVRTSTNGHFFNNKEDVEKLIKSGIDYIIVALDGASQETLSKFRKNSNFSQIVNGIKIISSLKKELKSKTPFVELQFIIMKHNEHEADKIKILAMEMGVNRLAIKSVGIFSPDQVQYLPSSTKLRRYKFIGNKIVWDVKIKNKCIELWRSSVINWDGKVIPCCVDVDEKYILGNAFNEPFLKIWNNKEYINFRRNILKNKNNIFLCSCCPGGADLNTKEISYMKGFKY